MSKRKVIWSKALILGFSVALVMGSVLFWLFSKPVGLRVTFFDVGQGDAILVRTPLGQNILIDGGPDRTILTKLGQSLPWYDHTIDLVVLTHPHADHLVGLLAVAQRYRLRRVLMTGVVHTSNEYAEWLNMLKNKRIPVTIAQAGQDIILPGPVILHLLWPPHSLLGQVSDDLNGTSIVLRLVYQSSSILLTGDAGLDQENSIIAAASSVKSQILKIGHHGSKQSTSLAWLKRVSPQIAIISVGRNNSYGHPAVEVIKRLVDLGIVIKRTDQAGDISFISYGSDWQNFSPLPILGNMLP